MGTGQRYSELREAAGRARAARIRPGRAQEESPFGLLGRAGNAAIVSMLERRNIIWSQGLTNWTHGRLPKPAVQRYSIKTRGKEEHQGQVGRPGYGKEGPTVGGVTVRTDEELISDDKKTTVPNVIALEYTGALTADSIWVQFVWFELGAETPRGHEIITGDGPSPSGPRPFSNAAAPKCGWTRHREAIRRTRRAAPMFVMPAPSPCSTSRVTRPRVARSA